MPPAKRISHDDPRWTQRKAAIRQMKADGKTQLQMRKKLEEDGFSVTKAELEAQLQFWGLRSRIPKNKSSAVWQYTDHHLSKRERAGRRSVVYHDGKLVESTRLEKERKRHQPSSLAKYTRVSSPKTPEEVLISICSPAAMPVQLQWPRNLPWLRFQENENAKHILSLSHQFVKLKPSQQQSKDSFDLDLSSLHRQDIGVSTGTFAEFAASLASMMPGSDGDEIVRRAQLLMQGTATQALSEHVRVILYGLSNNIYPLGYLDQFGFVEAHRWSLIVDLIERLGMVQQALDLRDTDDLTIASIAENMFKLCLVFKYSARQTDESIQASNTKIIKWLLDSGQNPDTRFYVGYNVSALEYVMENSDHELAIQLLDAGADPAFCGGPYASPLLLLLQDENETYPSSTTQEQETFRMLVRRLLEAGASTHEESAHSHRPSALMLAVMLDSQVADILIQHNASIQYQSNDDHWLDDDQSDFCKTRSVLGFAACNDDEEEAIENVQHLLDYARRSDPPIPAADLIGADVLCNAASRGFDRLISLCCNIDTGTAITQDELFPALCAASFYGHRKTCELLLRYGAPVNGPEGLGETPRPIHFAALSDACDVVELLCQYGASVNAEFTMKTVDRKNDLWSRVIQNDVLQSRVVDKFGDDALVRKIQIPCTSINSLGAAVFGAGAKCPLVFPVLLYHGARLPSWAVYYAACGRPDPWLICSAVDEGVNLNWHGPDGKTPLQAALAALSPPISPRRPKHRRPEIFSRSMNGCLSVIRTLVDAGAETAGYEPQLAVILRRWDLFDEVSPQDIGHDSRQTTYQMSTLAAAVLTRSHSMIQRVLSQTPTAYDHGALCAGVMLAISSDMVYPLQHLLSNYERYLHHLQLVGLALGLAAWYKRSDILDMLLSKVPSSSPALLPVHILHPEAHGIQPPPYEEEIEAILSDSFVEGTIPFWHREPESGFHLVLGSPLSLALWSGSCLDQLIANGCYPDRLTMSMAVCSGNITVVERLVRLPRLDNSHSDRPGPLYLSVENGDSDMMQLMLEAGEDPNEINHFVRRGRSPLQKAVEDGKLEMMKLLLDRGADVNMPAAAYRGATALQLAAITGRIGISKHLIDLRADVNARGAEEYGRTALEGAAEHGRLDMVHFLLDQGASVTGDGCLQYFRAISFARAQGHHVIAKFLENYREWTSSDHRNWEWLERNGAEWLTSLDEFEDESDSENSAGYDSCISAEDVDDSEEDGRSGGSQEDSVEAMPDDAHIEQMAVDDQWIPDRNEPTSLSQQPSSTNWFCPQNLFPTEREAGEIPGGDMSWLETQDYMDQIFDMDWSQ